MSLRWLPNAVTVGRMVLAAPLFWALVTGRLALAFWLAVIAGASDAIDGFLAKKYGWKTPAGGLLDPLADKLLLTACFVGLWWSQHLPPWLVVLVIARDLVIVGGAITWWRTLGPFQAEPSRLSKINTVLQIGLVAVVLADAAFAGVLPSAPDRAGPVPINVLLVLILVCAAFTFASGVDYVVRWGSRYRHASRNRP